MEIKDIIKLANNKEFDRMMDELEKLPPRATRTFYNEFINTGKDLYYDLIEFFSKEQENRFRWLDSTEREREYFMSIPDEEMTEQDWFDFRACDF